jgi:hypothetical protein
VRTRWRQLERYGEAFWRAHHEAWQQSALNQREYCEAHGIPLKAFRQLASEVQSRAAATGPQTAPPAPGLSHTLSHSVSHMTYGGAEPIVPPAREGHRRKFSEADTRRIVEEAVQPGASLSEVARRYGIAARVLAELDVSRRSNSVSPRTSLSSWKRSALFP